jgi:hypothetical protein
LIFEKKKKAELAEAGVLKGVEKSDSSRGHNEAVDFLWVVV